MFICFVLRQNILNHSTEQTAKADTFLSKTTTDTRHVNRATNLLSLHKTPSQIENIFKPN